MTITGGLDDLLRKAVMWALYQVRSNLSTYECKRRRHVHHDYMPARDRLAVILEAVALERNHQEAVRRQRQVNHAH